MRLTLRRRIVLTLLPLLLLLAAVGVAGVVLLYRLSHHIDAIMRENYRSVIYMQGLNEALERINSSLNFALAGHEDDAQEQYRANWKVFNENLLLEAQNVTLPGEDKLVDQLRQLADRYAKQGAAFFAQTANALDRVTAYHGPAGLLDVFKEIKTTSGEIQRINQENMEQASLQARSTALTSITAFAAGLGAAAVASVLLGRHMVRTILQPVRAVTASALGISSGNLDQVMPVPADDELGQLAEAFNLMARKLRDYRQSQLAQLLRAQRTSQATIDSFPDPVLVIDLDGRVEMANPAARHTLGVKPGPNGAASTAAWQPPAPLVEPLTDALQGRRNFLPEEFAHAILLGDGGRERALLPRILTIRDPEGATLGAAVLLQDVTRLRLLDQVKSNLVATASHELKTPLTSVRLAVHLLLEEAVGPLSPKQTELLLDARDNSERLLTVVNNLLDLARLEQDWGQLELQPQSPRSLLEAAGKGIAARARDKEIEVVLDAPPELPPVGADVSRLHHAFQNLMDNALNFTDRGGRITLSASQENDAVVLAVADTGIGIPAEHVPHVFDRFYSVPGQSRDNSGGTGLGLAIVREIVAAHGGTVACESEPGVGTTFRIRLPIAKSTPVECPLPQATSLTPDSPRQLS